MHHRLFKPLHNSPWKAALASAIVVFAFLAVPWYFIADFQESRRQQLSEEAERHLAGRVAHIEASLQRAKSFPSIAALAMSQSGHISRFERALHGLLRMSGIVESVKITPTGGGPVVVINRSEMEQKKLADFRFDSATVHNLEMESHQQFAIGEGTLVITQAVNETNTHGISRNWGYITAEASLADLIQELHLLTLVNNGFGVHFSMRWQSGAPESVIFSGGNLADTIFTATIPLVGNDMLILTIAPPHVAFAGFPLFSAISIAISAVLLFLFSYHLMRRPYHLQREVEFRTQEIAAEKAALNKEIAIRLEAEHNLKNSYTLLDSIFEHIPGMIVLKRVSDFRVTRINQSAERILGRSRDCIIGRSNEELYSPETAKILSHGDKLALVSRDMADVVEMAVLRVEILAAEPRWIEFRKAVLVNQEGCPQYILEFATDVTQREDLDRQLREQLHFHQQLIEAFPGPFFSKDISGRFTAVNASFEQFVGKSRQNILGKTVADITSEPFALEHMQADKALLETGEKQVYESQMSRSDGSLIETMIHKAMYKDSEGKIDGIVGVALDISERKIAERNVAALNSILTVLSQINHLIIHTRDLVQLFEQARRVLQSNNNFPAVWIRLWGTGYSLLVDETIRPLAQQIIDEIDKPGSICAVRREIRCHRLMHDNTKLSVDLKAIGLQPLLLLPLVSGYKDWGDIGIIGTIGQVFSETETSLLEELAGNLSFAATSIQHEQARQIAESNLQLASHVFENSAEGVMVTDCDSKILLVNRRFTEITGYSSDEVIGKTPRILNSGQQDASFYGNMWRALKNRGEWHGEVRNRRKDGELIVEWLNISVVRNVDGTVTNYVGIFAEITVHKKLKKRMQFLAHYDVLTSLPNRVLFSDRLEQSIINAKRNQCMAALLLIDLDHFDTINKNMGHAAGDAILQEISKRLLACVPEGSSVSRLGSDEFAVVLPDIKSTADPAAMAGRLLHTVHRNIVIDDADLSISASVGISIYPRDGTDSEVLIKSAETAMYQAAEGGGNRYRVFNPPTRETLTDRQKLRERLYHAIERDELRVFYQPLISAATGRIVGAEALLRWFRSESGFVSPQTFVPLLEESGLVVRVGDWVLRTALEAATHWREAYGCDLPVTVNLSPVEFLDELCVERIESALRDLAVAPSYLQIEMTESTIMREAPGALMRLHQLHDMGIKLSIDGFGTGYSSMSYLNRFPFDSIKIDRSFVFDTPNDAEAVATVKTIVAMGKSFSVEIAAEGIETQGQIDFLRDLGCETLQGHHFSQAVSADGMAKLLASNARFNVLRHPISTTPELLHLVG